MLTPSRPGDTSPCRLTRKIQAKEIIASQNQLRRRHPGVIFEGAEESREAELLVIGVVEQVADEIERILGPEQEQSEIDGMEGSRSAGAKMASVRMDKPGAFEWKRSLLLVSI